MSISPAIRERLLARRDEPLFVCRLLRSLSIFISIFVEINRLNISGIFFIALSSFVGMDPLISEQKAKPNTL
jgi:hypothetical protein